MRQNGYSRYTQKELDASARREYQSMLKMMKGSQEGFKRSEFKYTGWAIVFKPGENWYTLEVNFTLSGSRQTLNIAC